MSNLNFRPFNMIVVNSLKGGCGKSLISYLIVKFLVNQGIRVKVFELDPGNRGLTGFINKYSNLEEKNKVICERHPYDQFFTNLYLKLKLDTENWDIGVVDGFVFPGEFTKIKRIFPYLMQVIYVIPNDESLNEEDLKISMHNYITFLGSKLTFVFNCKQNNLDLMKHFCDYSLKQYYSIVQEAKITDHEKPNIYTNYIPYQKDVKDLISSFNFVNDFLNIV